MGEHKEEQRKIKNKYRYTQCPTYVLSLLSFSLCFPKYFSFKSLFTIYLKWHVIFQCLIFLKPVKIIKDKTALKMITQCFLNCDGK